MKMMSKNAMQCRNKLIYVLKETNSYDKFIDNLQREKYWSSIDELVNAVSIKNKFYSLFAGAFCWCLTKEGEDYWRGLYELFVFRYHTLPDAIIN